MFLLACKSPASRTNNRKAAPESLQFTSILPRTLLVMMVPFLKGQLSTYRNGRRAYSLFTTASSVSTISK